MWSTRIRNCIFVAVGAAALVAAVKLQIAPARAAIVIDDGPAAAAPPPSTSSQRKRGKRTPAPAPTPPSKDPPKLTNTLALASSPLLAVPDFKGKRLSVAMREARKLGLKLYGEAYGEPILADEASGYRVRRQLTKPGTEVAPGTAINVAVRVISAPGEGY